MMLKRVADTSWLLWLLSKCLLLQGHLRAWGWSPCPGAATPLSLTGPPHLATGHQLCSPLGPLEALAGNFGQETEEGVEAAGEGAQLEAKRRGRRWRDLPMDRDVPIAWCRGQGSHHHSGFLWRLGLLGGKNLKAHQHIPPAKKTTNAKNPPKNLPPQKHTYTHKKETTKLKLKHFPPNPNQAHNKI